MADSVELRMSVTSIKRVDPYVKDLLATSTHVALYKFNPVSNEWEKTETEGALFLYSRNGEPYHSIMIMNRLNTNNLIEPIVKEFDYQMQVPFLLYRNSKGKIFGIWFFSREECVSITLLLESLMEQLREKNAEKSRKKENSVDIFSMLSKAQEDFNKTPNKSEMQQQFSTPRAPDVTSQSVMDFFAKASGKTAQSTPIATGENFLQRLMSNPAHSVEHIEKQQRSITPQDQVPIRQKIFNHADRRSIPIAFPNTSAEHKIQIPENGLNYLRMSSPQQSTMHGTSPLATFLMQAQNQAAEETTEVRETSPLAQLLETGQKPALMPPIMFASSSKEKTEPSVVADTKLKSVEPLTKNQLLCALSYLIRTDPDFANKLHEAYVKSLTELVNHNSSSNSLI